MSNQTLKLVKTYRECLEGDNHMFVGGGLQVLQKRWQTDEYNVARQAFEVVDNVLLGKYLPRLQISHLASLRLVFVCFQVNLEYGWHELSSKLQTRVISNEFFEPAILPIL